MATRRTVGGGERAGAVPGPGAGVDGAGGVHAAGDDDDDGGGRAIGDHVLSLRRRRGLSIERLAQVSGVSRSAISDIERGRTVPTVNVVGRLARALGVDVAVLAGESPRPAIVVRGGGVADDSEPGSASSRPLAPGGRGAAATLVEVRLPARSRYRVDEVHAGILHNVFVAEGRLGIELGDDQYLLGPGDALQVRDAAPCSYVNWSGEPTLLYVVLSP